MRTPLLLVALAAASLGCGQDLARRHDLPPNIKTIAVRLGANKSQQFGLEDKLTNYIRDQFLRDGTYPVVAEENADGVVAVTVQKYIVTPIQYDSGLNPIAYKLRIVVDLQFVDRAANRVLFEEKNMEGLETYAASTLPGGLTEPQAQESIWDSLSRDIVARVEQGH